MANTRSPFLQARAYGVGERIVADSRFAPNNVYFVNSTTGTDSASAGQSPDTPFDTIDYAIGQCTASKGDVILVMPEHVETIAAAGGIACDVAGIKIIGLGQGALRPTVTFSATTSTWTVSAASVTIQNIRVTSSVNELVKMFSVTAADVTLDGVDYIDPGSAKETLQFLLTTSGAKRITVKNCKHLASTAGASAQLWIALVGVEEGRIIDNTFMLKLNDAATSSVINLDTDVRLVEMARNRILMTGYSASLLSAILGHANATGIHYDSRIAGDVAAVTTLNDFPGGYSNEVYCVRAVDKSGILDPVVS